MIYLDYSANTPADPEVLARFCQIESTLPGNPNSLHSAGRAARAEIDRATTHIAELLHVQPGELIYTSGASEANNLALKGIAHLAAGRGKHIITTPLEHSSVSGCLTALQREGFTVDTVKLLPDGTADLAHLRSLLREDTILAAVTAVDSELGVIQPVEKIAEIVHTSPHCRLHVDATQAMGKTPFSFAGADTVSFTAHKFYGLNGIGVLWKRRGLAIEPLIHGGESTTLYRSGTPTTALISSLELALQKALCEIEERRAIVTVRNAFLRKALSRYEDVRINSPEGAVPHILNVSVSGVKGTVFQRLLDEKGVCVSVKSACASDGLPSSAVLAVSGDRRNALSSWRISLSHLTTQEECERFLEAFEQCRRELERQ